MIDALVTYLSGVEGSSFESVEHAWDSEPVEITTDTLPRLFAFPGDESTQGDGTDSQVSKRLQLEVRVYLVCAIETLETLKTELRGAVIGWNPGAASGYDDLELVSGRTMSLKGGVVWWEDIYTTWRTIREIYS